MKYSSDSTPEHRAFGHFCSEPDIGNEFAFEQAFETRKFESQCCSNANSFPMSGSEQKWPNARCSGVESEEYFIQTSSLLMESIQTTWKKSLRSWDVEILMGSLS